ncbi:ARM repeat-containing protein [Polychaeton citri CBS 116435]|uniref:Pumilio homology domain family member 3 n=1 Tax=Polychaeton citri CBS 116435 TaxID=1314669 RepID=A0A9P4Q9F3_9PEZI|nr:ARM repeat-containing protein [Polychaeton citri CBS 116435]
MNENARTASLSSPSTTFSNGSANAPRAWDSGNIWSTNGSLNNSRFASRDATRENSRSREGDHVEGKTGSGSLVGSSIKDDSSVRARPGKHSIGSAPAFMRPQVEQARGGSDAGFFSNVPPPISLNSNGTFAHPMSGFTNPFSGSNGRTIDSQPPNVYTKRDRKDNLGKIDSARSVYSTSATTPVDEIGPFFSQASARSTPPSSRDRSQFTGRFLNNNKTHPSTNSTSPLAVRNPSVPFTPYSASEDQLSSMFGQTTLGDNPPTSRNRPATSSNGLNSFTSSLSPTSPNRPTTAGYSDISHSNDESGGFGYFSGNASNPSLTNVTIPSTSTSIGRFASSTSGLDFRPGSHHSNGSVSSRGDVNATQKHQQDWASFDNDGMSRLPGIHDHQAWLDPRTQHLLGNQLRNPYGAMFPPYAVPGPLQINGLSPYLAYPVLPSPMAPFDGAMPTRDQQPESVQSRLMYDFKTNSKTNKRYELKDIYDHIAEFSGDQHGSRFIQQKLETANSDEKERVFQEIRPNAVVLMTDVFGNYVIQKFFEHGDQNQKKILASMMKGQVLGLSLQMYGCRVVQKALEHILVDQQALLIHELENHVLRCVKDQNGNHVVQKAIERCPRNAVQFIIDAFRGQVHSLSVHSYGCRVIQRCLEHCDPVAKDMIMSELHDGMTSLITDQYGNYVVQHVVEHGNEQDRLRVLQLILRSLETYSKHKYASNVVEKCIACAGNGWRRDVVRILANGQQRMSEEGSPLVSLINDSYGNYVIQKLLEILPDTDYFDFVEILRPTMNVAKRAGYGKTAIAIEKKMNRFPTLQNNRAPAYPAAAPLPHPSLMGHFVTANGAPRQPPALLMTAGNEEPRNGRMYGTTGDTVEGADSLSRRGSEALSQDRVRMSLQ